MKKVVLLAAVLCGGLSSLNALCTAYINGAVTCTQPHNEIGIFVNKAETYFRQQRESNIVAKQRELYWKTHQLFQLDQKLGEKLAQLGSKQKSIIETSVYENKVEAVFAKAEYLSLELERNNVMAINQLQQLNNQILGMQFKKGFEKAGQ